MDGDAEPEYGTEGTIQDYQELVELDEDFGFPLPSDADIERQRVEFEARAEWLRGD